MSKQTKRRCKSCNRAVPTKDLNGAVVLVLHITSCYEYQSCEHPTWEKSAAAKFCQSLRSEAIARLPGYEAAPWEYTRETVSA